MTIRNPGPPGPRPDVDVEETRRRFLLAREQAAQAYGARYRAVRALRGWPAGGASTDRAGRD